MKVVCLILGPVLASQPCSMLFCFDVPKSAFIFIQNYFCFHCFFFLNGVNLVLRLQKYCCKLYNYHEIIQHNIFLNICSSMKVSLLYISIIYAFFFTYRGCLFSISLTALSAVLVSAGVNHPVFQCLSSYHSI